MDIQSNIILIVGAGPTGLMLANQLTRFGIDYIIVDQKAGPTDQSRALVVHARSMEIYQQLGLSDAILSDGQPNDGLELYRNGKLAASVTIVNAEEKSSPFPFLMMYEQSKNESLLYGNLLAQHKTVQWNTRIISIEQQNGTYTIKAQQNGNEINYQCNYLIACDGSKSMVRDFSQVPFTGGSYLNVFYVADTHIDAGLASKKLSLFLTKHSVTMLFPMKALSHFRLLGILPKQYYHRDEIPFEEILVQVKKEMMMPVNFYDTNWHSTYKLHHKKVACFNKGQLFFVGDAAHVHSPAGGQGMNTGLQDAYNLAWKLALVQQRKADAVLLNTYHEERNSVAEDLLKTTDRLFSAMIADNFWYALLRMHVIPLIVPLVSKWKFVRKQLFPIIAQLKINYKASSLSKGKAGTIQAGIRLPYFFVEQNSATISIYDLLNHTAKAPFTVVLCNIDESGFATLDAQFFNLLCIDRNTTNSQTLKQIGFTPSFVMVVRPDNHIGYISASATMQEVRDFMEKAYTLKLV